jgi:hypothetical protein
MDQGCSWSGAKNHKKSEAGDTYTLQKIEWGLGYKRTNRILEGKE